MKREGLLGVVGATMEAKRLHDSMEQLGYPDTPYWNLFSDLVDAIYKMIDEETDMLEESRTYEALYTPGLTNAERVNILLGT